MVRWELQVLDQVDLPLNGTEPKPQKHNHSTVWLWDITIFLGLPLQKRCILEQVSVCLVLREWVRPSVLDRTSTSSACLLQFDQLLQTLRPLWGRTSCGGGALEDLQAFSSIVLLHQVQI